MEINVSYLLITPTDFNPFSSLTPFYVFNLTREGKGKLVFANQNYAGEFSVINEIEEEHIEFIQDKVQFSEIDYTLYIPSILGRMNTGHDHYDLELFTDAFIRVLTSYSETKPSDFIKLLFKAKSVSVYVGVGRGLQRVEDAIERLGKSFASTQIKKESKDLLMLVDYDIEHHFTIDEHLLLTAKVRESLGAKNQVRCSKLVNHSKQPVLGVSLVVPNQVSVAA